MMSNKKNNNSEYYRYYVLYINILSIDTGWWDGEKVRRRILERVRMDKVRWTRFFPFPRWQWRGSGVRWVCVDWGLIYSWLFFSVLSFILRTDCRVMLDIAEIEKSTHLLGNERLKLYSDDCCCLWIWWIWWWWRVGGVVLHGPRVTGLWAGRWVDFTTFD